MTRKAIKTTATIGSNAVTTEGAAAGGREEVTDMVNACDMEARRDHRPSTKWLLSGACGPCRILAQKCVLLRGRREWRGRFFLVLEQNLFYRCSALNFLRRLIEGPEIMKTP